MSSLNISEKNHELLEELAKRGMNLQCNISDEELTLIGDDKSMIITQNKWK